MKKIAVMFDINDVIYRADGDEWDSDIQNYRNYVVGKYIIRSISISCNSKSEWKISYRVQREIDGKIIYYGFNFREDEVGSTVFVNYKDAKEHCVELAHNNYIKE